MHAGAPAKVFKNASLLRSNMTETEMRVWQWLKTKPKGFKFRRQHPFGIYILDFFCFKARLSIEIDGDYHKLNGQIDKDEVRTNDIQDLGIKEIRFTDDQVMNEFSLVKQTILNHLRVGSL